MAQLGNPSPQPSPFVPHGEREKLAVSPQQCLIQWQCTLTLSRPTGEGTARHVARSFRTAWITRTAEDDSPSPIRWEKAGVRVSVRQNLKLFLHESLMPENFPAKQLLSKCAPLVFTQSIHFVTFCAENYGEVGRIQSRPELAQRTNRSRRAPMNWSGAVSQPLYVLSVGSARAWRAVFGALAEHTVRSAGCRPVQPRRLRSPS